LVGHVLPQHFRLLHHLDGVVTGVLLVVRQEHFPEMTTKTNMTEDSILSRDRDQPMI
jgi:hypothetical protein